MYKSISFFLIAFCFLCVSSQSNAAQVPVTLTINEILSLDNPYSLNMGDTFEWQVRYDPAKIFISGGEEWLSPGSDPSLQINGTIGTFSFDISDILFQPFAPALHFTGSVLDGFFMMFVVDAPYQNLMGGNVYECKDVTDTTLYRGTFDFEGAQVPLPGSFIILLHGIAGLAVFRKTLSWK